MFGFNQCDDEPHDTGGDVQSTSVGTHEELQIDVADIVNQELAERWERRLDLAMTCLVVACIVCGIGWTAWRFSHGQSGTSHALYALAKAYPGVVFLIGIWIGMAWSEWVARHPWWTGLAAYLLGHCLFPIWPW